jgi:hypothetical protein
MTELNLVQEFSTSSAETSQDVESEAAAFSAAITNKARQERATRAATKRNQSGRRRLTDPTTTERDYSAAETEFMLAMQEYKKSSGRMFPTWSEVLEVLRNLGYQKAQLESS